MRKFTYMAIVIVLTVVVLTACETEQDSIKSEIKEVIGIDVNKASVARDDESHGGFHGDGSSFTVLRFSDNKISKQILKQDDWKSLPLSKNITALVYGTSTENESVGPYLTNENGEPLIPKIHKGYYYFLDRHSESTDRHDDSKTLERSALNLTIAIYDADQNVLYYATLDT